jgi:hypothetical protein
MSEITFTGHIADPVKEMSKKEPSVELITTVKVPRHEYALLVAAKAKLDLVEKMVNGMDSYAAFPVLKLLFTPRVLEEDAE